MMQRAGQAVLSFLVRDQTQTFFFFTARQCRARWYKAGEVGDFRNVLMGDGIALHYITLMR